MTDSSRDTTALLGEALGAADPSVRLRAALHAGTRPDPGLIDPLIARCAVEPDFYVRDMLTWALTRQPPERTVPLLVSVLNDDAAPPQAHAQALHTLSKIGDRSAWNVIGPRFLNSPDDDIARAAWRAAVALVPDGQAPALAGTLAARFGAGGFERRRSLSRALAALGAPGAAAAEAATHSPDPRVVAHAEATLRLVADPDAAFDDHVAAAWRLLAPGAGVDVAEDAVVESDAEHPDDAAEHPDDAAGRSDGAESR
ncbi:MAG: HEAT repeat domain-containing protein [Gordonia sp. (in: high G+C Gram-positive bacteria)]|uniref:HEAT repeat domain-containing protein n=1 Tax=Gordonia sp. (in: high G+C Gram-positive bacteria) TaxID=84139 RepID=UPI0039E56DC5